MSSSVVTTPQLRPEEQLPAETAHGDAALVCAEAPAPPFSIAQDPAVAAIPIQVDVAVPVRNFRVANVLALEPGGIIESRWGHSEDLPLCAGDVQLAWCEFETIDMQLGVRITRLA